MQEADARRIATLMAEVIRQEHREEDRQAPALSAHSLKDILRVGMLVVQSQRQFAEVTEEGAFPVGAEMLAAFACLPFDPSPWIELTTSALQQSTENAVVLEATISNIIVPKAKIAGAMAELTAKFQQQSKTYASEDRNAMYLRWIALRPLIEAVLDIQHRFPLTSTADALRMLSASFPGLTKHVEVHIPTLEAFVAGSTKYAAAKQTKTKAHLLASAIVADEFGLGNSYCLQLLEETRRTQHGRMRRPKK